MKFLFFILFIQLLTANLFSQGTQLSLNNSFKDYIVQRNSDAVRYQNSNLQTMGGTRFLSIFHSNGIGSWALPKQKILIDGESYNTFPLNISSVDLLPFDFINADTIEINMSPSLNYGNVTQGGYINFIPNTILDSIKIKSRIFFGSETGDPIIHIFTDPNNDFPNKHKTGFSGIVSLSDGNKKLRYRFTTGWYLYFSTGSLDSDPSIYFYNTTLSNKQNRQLFGSAELEYHLDKNRKIKLYTGIVNQFGWEKSPVTSLYSLLSGTSFTFRTKFENIFNNLDITIKNDASIMHKRVQKFTEAGKYFLNMSEVKVNYKINLNENVRLNIIPGLSFEHVSPIDNRNNFFPIKVNNIFYYTSLNLHHLLYKNFDYDFNIRYDISEKYKNLFSSSLVTNYRFSEKHSFKNEVYTIATYPGIFERNIKYKTSRALTNNNLTEYVIKGNPFLTPERINGTSLSYNFKQSDKVNYSLNIFYNHIINPIDFYNEEISISSYPGDIVRNGFYKNFPKRIIYGGDIEFAAKITKWFVLRNSYRFLENKDVLYSPKHLARSTFEFLLPYSVRLLFIPSFISKTEWNHFTVSTNNDFHKNIGTNGIVDETFIVDAGIQYDFGKFYFFGNLSLRGEIQNIFDRRMRYLPIGNNLETAVFFYLTAEL